MFFDKYPYTDMHELNLDWILAKMKELDQQMDDFTVYNQITWAGVWDATKSYVKWSIVQDTGGNGYLSLQPVPPNVPLTSTAYWTRVANYDALYAAFNIRISALESRTINGHPLSNNVTVNASDVPYSGNLSAGNVKAALDELHAANDVTFDNNGLSMRARVRNGVVAVTTLSGTLTAAVNNGSVLITIPDGFHSFETIEALDSASRRYLIATNGQVIPTVNLPAGTAVRLSVTYLT